MNKPIKLAPGEVAKIDQPESWEQRFDKKFGLGQDESPSRLMSPSWREWLEIKDFIRQELAEQRLKDSIEPEEV
jgi:hypothetical protein